MSLAGNDILKIDDITKEPLEKCLLYLSYQVDVNQLQELLHNEAMAKIK